MGEVIPLSKKQSEEEYYQECVRSLDHIKTFGDIHGAAVIFSISVCSIVFFKIAFDLHAVIQKAIAAYFV